MRSDDSREDYFLAMTCFNEFQPFFISKPETNYNIQLAKEGKIFKSITAGNLIKQMKILIAK
jgi:hypothetical protein